MLLESPFDLTTEEWERTGINSLILIGAIIAGLILKALIFRSFRIFLNRRESFTLESLHKELNAPLSVFLPLLVLSLVIPSLNFQLLDKAVSGKILESLQILAFAWVLIRLVNVFEAVILRNNTVTKDNNWQERKIVTQLVYLKRIVIVVIVVISVAVVLMSFDNVRKIGTGIITSAGVAGIILGFAAQRSIANLLAGLQIAFTQPIRIDDVLVVEGEWGRVEEITLTYVVVGIWDQRRLVLPINYFIEKPFQNWTRRTSDILGTVYLYLDYTVPIEALRGKLKELVDGHPLWDGRVAVVQVTNTTERTMEVRALVSAGNSSNAWDLRCFIREQLITYVREHYPESFPRFRTEFTRIEENKELLPMPDEGGNSRKG